MSHWYNTKGEPVFTIKGKNGKERKPYQKEAYEMGLLPSVTTILDTLDKGYNLKNWINEQVIKACISTPFEYIDFYSYKKKVMELAFKDSEKAKNFGDVLHKWLQDLHRKEKSGWNYTLIPEKTKEALIEHFQKEVSKVLFSETPVYDLQMKTAGIPDLECLLTDGRKCIYDYKNQGTKEKGKSVIYDEYWIQASAYAGMVNADCVRILVVSRDEPGNLYWEERSGEFMESCQREFKAYAKAFNTKLQRKYGGME